MGCRLQRGVQPGREAQTWLDTARNGWLWAIMIVERDLLPRAIDRRALEVSFLSRIHQRMYSQGLGKQAKTYIADDYFANRKPLTLAQARCQGRVNH